MSTRNLSEHLTRLYAEKSLPSETASRLEELAGVDLQDAPRRKAYRAPGRWPQRLTSLAASVALLLSISSLYMVQTRNAAIPVVELPLTVPPDAGASDIPALVMVKFQIDGCPLAAAVEPAFAALLRKYANEPGVVFARCDITETTLRQSCALAACLGVDWAYEGPHQSGMIKLIDRERGEVLATLTDQEQMPELETVLARALP